MKTYKVWLHIEEYDDDEDEYTDIGLPHDAGEFATVEEAVEFVGTVLDVI